MGELSLKLYTVDAFTDVPFKGNPAAVCPLPQNADLSDSTLQNIACEMNLSETVFIKLLNKADSFKEASKFGLRWFTPAVEVDLCGHATLASAAVLFDKLGNMNDSITFKTLSGDLKVKREGTYIHMDFPASSLEEEDVNEHAQLIESLGDVPGVSDIYYCESQHYFLVRLHDGWSRSEFEAWSPDLAAMEASTDRVQLVIVTTRGPAGDGYHSTDGKAYDFVSRCFGPWTDIGEDPVTGSAHTVLAHYWSQVLGMKEFFARQCSKRGGEVVVRLQGDRVELMGQAAFVMESVLTL